MTAGQEKREITDHLPDPRPFGSDGSSTLPSVGKVTYLEQGFQSNQSRADRFLVRWLDAMDMDMDMVAMVVVGGGWWVLGGRRSDIDGRLPSPSVPRFILFYFLNLIFFSWELFRFTRSIT